MEPEGLALKYNTGRYQTFDQAIRLMQSEVNPIHVTRAERWIRPVDASSIDWVGVAAVAFPHPTNGELRLVRRAMARFSTCQPLITQEPIVPCNPRLWRSMFAKEGSILFHLLHAKNRLSTCISILSIRRSGCDEAAYWAQTFDIHELHILKALDHTRLMYELDEEASTLSTMILVLYGEVEVALDLP